MPDFTTAQATQILNVIGNDSADALILQVGLIKALATIDATPTGVDNAIQSVLSMRILQPEVVTISNLSLMLSALEIQNTSDFRKQLLTNGAFTSYSNFILMQTVLPAYLRRLEGRVTASTQQSITQLTVLRNQIFELLDFRSIGESGSFTTLKNAITSMLSTEAMAVSPAFIRNNVADVQVKVLAKISNTMGTLVWTSMTAEERIAYVKQQISTYFDDRIVSGISLQLNSSGVTWKARLSGVASSLANLNFLFLSLGGLISNIGSAIYVDENADTETQNLQRALAIVGAISFAAQALHISTSVVLDAIWAKYTGRAYGDVSYQQAIWKRFTQGIDVSYLSAKRIQSRLQNFPINNDVTIYGDVTRVNTVVSDSFIKKEVYKFFVEGRFANEGNRSVVALPTAYKVIYADDGTTIFGYRKFRGNGFTERLYTLFEIEEDLMATARAWEQLGTERVVEHIISKAYSNLFESDQNNPDVVAKIRQEVTDLIHQYTQVVPKLQPSLSSVKQQINDWVVANGWDVARMTYEELLRRINAKYVDEVRLPSENLMRTVCSRLLFRYFLRQS